MSATAYLADAQLPTGGWDSGFGENANSTALALQALSALGEDFLHRWRRMGSKRQYATLHLTQLSKQHRRFPGRLWLRSL
ncbi:MAG: hypothetical protein M5U34_14755 [Chloroflexi bacterium]|nr:hypothetical protein [Chloroflexota bacterium]